MASVPNTRAAPVPVPGGVTPPAALADPAGFARQLAELPEELLRINAAILSSGGDAPAPDGDDAPAPDGIALDSGDAAATDTAEASSDAAQLAALAPLLQSLPAVVAAPAVTPAPAPAATPAVAASATTPAPTATPAPIAAPAPGALKKVEISAAKTPAPTTTFPAPVLHPTGKVGRVQPEAESGETGETGAEAGTPEPTSALDAAAREAISTARKIVEAALRATGPALAEAAPKAVQVATAAFKAAGHALPHVPGAATEAPIADIATSAALANPAAPAPAPAQSAPIQPREAVAGPAAGAASGPALDIANDAEWLDRLARDIAQASGNEGTIRFRLHPQTLGHLRVELSQGDHGTSIRLTTDTEQARAILADAQPRLVAEARAQGLRIAETHVDLSGSDRHFSGDPRRQDDSRQTPLIRTARDAAAEADAPDRPGRSRSDRYA